MKAIEIIDYNHVDITARVYCRMGLRNSKRIVHVAYSEKDGEWYTKFPPTRKVDNVEQLLEAL